MYHICVITVIQSFFISKMINSIYKEHGKDSLMQIPTARY